MYKIIACDLDETLVSDDRTISKRNIEAIKKATELGVKFIPATGRGYETVQNTLKKLGLWNKENEYVISFNGGAIVENKGNKILHFEGLPFELAEKIYQKGLTYDVCIHVYTMDTVFVYNLNQDEKDFLRGRMEVVEINDQNLDFLKGQDIVKILFEYPDYPYLNKIEENLKNLTEGKIDVSYSSNRYIEFNHKNVNKGTGLKFIADRLGVDIKDTMAIGDNFNDLTMIKAAGLGVGVQNTTPDMKPMCDYITDATNNEGAVGEAIEKFVLSEQH